MRIINLPTASVTTAAGGTVILSQQEAADGTSQGMTCVVVNPDVDIVLVDAAGAAAATPGTVANSPWTCPANTPTVIQHRSGQLRAISTSGTATVKRSIGCAP